MTEKKKKSLLHNPDRVKARKESRKKMKEKIAPEIKKVKSISLEEVLR